ncbi:MAG: hypothetical protein ACK51U_04235 [bacterium]
MTNLITVYLSRRLVKGTQGQYTCNKSLQVESNGDSHPQFQKSQLWN